MEKIAKRIQPPLSEEEMVRTHVKTLLKKLSPEQQDIAVTIAAKKTGGGQLKYYGDGGARAMYEELSVMRLGWVADSKFESEANLFSLHEGGEENEPTVISRDGRGAQDSSSQREQRQWEPRSAPPLLSQTLTIPQTSPHLCGRLSRTCGVLSSAGGSWGGCLVFAPPACFFFFALFVHTDLFD